eukprot:jgi/Mesvir1/19991/Mv13248-RA.1
MISAGEERCVVFANEFVEKNRRADARWCAMKARSHSRHAKRLIYDCSGCCRVCSVRGETKRVPLTEGEEETLREYSTRGVEALSHSRLFTDWMESEPRHGWVMCSYCGIPMPAGKVEECVPVSHTRLFQFMHSSCYEKSLVPVWKRQEVDMANKKSSEGDSLSDEPEFPQLPPQVWDLDKPEFSSYD